ncbi:MAG TPA: DUF84 family protein [Candidatus Baltobacteraceae bacterium]|nr:DUF84 family protein [Candidatus Baltobacteraceae bacterium]
MIRIIVGSKSAFKVDAVKAAAASLGLEADVVGVDVISGVPSQPFGLVETQNGALARALAAHAADPAAYAVGIENGIVKEGGAYRDFAVVDLLTPSVDHHRVRSEGVTVPAELAKVSWESGQRVTAGKLEAQRSGFDHADPHRVWSGGKTDRKTILIAAVREALFAATRTEGVPSMSAPKTLTVTIAGVTRTLPVRRVPAGIRIAILRVIGDPELTEAAGKALAKLVPSEVDVIVMPDGKAQPLLHVVQRELSARRGTLVPAVLCRKDIKSYMLEPIIDSSATSATTAQSVFHMDAEDAAAVRGKTVAFLDDVISMGGTSDAIRRLLDKAGAGRMIQMAVGTEGNERPDVIALHHFPVFPG